MQNLNQDFIDLALIGVGFLIATWSFLLVAVLFRSETRKRKREMHDILNSACSVMKKSKSESWAALITHKTVD